MTREQALERALARLLDSGPGFRPVDLRPETSGRVRVELRPTLAAVRTALRLLGVDEPEPETPA